MNLDLNKKRLREINQILQNVGRGKNNRSFQVLNPQGQHAICAGLKDDIEISIKGHTGYYCAGMNQNASVNRTWKCWYWCCGKYDVWKGHY